MDNETGRILHVETVDKREVDLKSPNMEREALKRSLQFLTSENITVTELVTDASSSIRKMLGYYLFTSMLDYFLIMQKETIQLFYISLTYGTKQRN